MGGGVRCPPLCVPPRCAFPSWWCFGGGDGWGGEAERDPVLMAPQNGGGGATPQQNPPHTP